MAENDANQELNEVTPLNETGEVIDEPVINENTESEPDTGGDGTITEPEPTPEPEPDIPEIPEVPKEENVNQNRRKKIMRYGLKEVADVVFFDIKTGRPVLIFDTLKVSNIENAAESTEATGGKGNAPLVSWDYGRTATLTMQDALLSDKSLAMLAGSTVRDASASGVNITRYEVIDVGEAGAIETTYEPVGEVVAYDNEGGSLGEEMVVTGEAGALVATGATAGDRVAVFYESEAEEGATVVTFSSDKFPAIYRVVGTSLVRDEDGLDHAFQFVIPRAKLQAGFTFTMDPENVSTFDFNLNVLVDPTNKTLYDIIRM